VNNAVKHSGADIIAVYSSLRDRTWQIKISDNGRGFSTAEKLRRGDTNGLINMQDRAVTGNFSVVIHSGTERSTSVDIEIEL
jgi:signal transduction histidine kinase